MQVFILGSDSERYQSVTCKDKKDVHKFMYWHGQSLAFIWKPIQLEIPEATREAWESDFPSFEGTPTYSQRAVNALRDILEKTGELLPLSFGKRTYYAHNVTHSIDGLDQKRSVFDKYGLVERYEFIPRILENEVVFKLRDFLPESVKIPWPHITDRKWLPPGREVARAEIYVTDSFLERVRAAALVGFDFEKVWEDGKTGQSRERKNPV